MNARYKEHELSYVLRDADAVAIVTTDLVSEYVDFVPVIERATVDPPPFLRHRIMLGASSPEGYLDRAAFDAASARVPVEEVHCRRRAVRLRDVVVLMYTSGTTAEPKGCLISHESLARTSLGIVERFDLTEDEKFWDPLPLFHMAGLLLLLSNVSAGGTFLSMTHFEPGAALRQMEAEGCTFAYPCFPTITQSILRHPDYERTDLGRVRALLDTAPPATLREIGRRIPQAVVLTSYGLTEGGGVVAFSHLDDPEQRAHRDRRPPVPGHGGADRRPRLRRGACRSARWGRSSCAAPASSTATTATPSAPPRSCAAAGSTRAISAASTRRGASPTSAAPRTCSRSEARTSPRSRSRPSSAAIPTSRSCRSSACRTTSTSRCRPPSSSSTPAGTVTEDELLDYCRGTIAAFKVPRYVRFVTDWPMSATKIQKHRLREALLVELGLDGPPA